MTEPFLATVRTTPCLSRSKRRTKRRTEVSSAGFWRFRDASPEKPFAGGLERFGKFGTGHGCLLLPCWFLSDFCGFEGEWLFSEFRVGRVCRGPEPERWFLVLNEPGTSHHFTPRLEEELLPYCWRLATLFYKVLTVHSFGSWWFQVLLKEFFQHSKHPSSQTKPYKSHRTPIQMSLPFCTHPFPSHCHPEKIPDLFFIPVSIFRFSTVFPPVFPPKHHPPPGPLQRPRSASSTRPVWLWPSRCSAAPARWAQSFSEQRRREFGQRTDGVILGKNTWNDTKATLAMPQCEMMRDIRWDMRWILLGRRIVWWCLLWSVGECVVLPGSFGPMWMFGMSFSGGRAMQKLNFFGANRPTHQTHVKWVTSQSPMQKHAYESLSKSCKAFVFKAERLQQLHRRHVCQVIQVRTTCLKGAGF